MNLNTLLHRQINPAWVQQKRVTSQAFKPTPKDQNLLSVYHGDLITAEESYNHFVRQKLNAVGVLSVSVDECTQAKVEARTDPVPFPEHAVIDFGSMSKGQVEKPAKMLSLFAWQRGWQFQP